MQKLLSYPARENSGPRFPATANNTLKAINNHLKSPEEIDAECFSLSKAASNFNSFEDSDQINPDQGELEFSINAFSLILPEFMEENY